VINDNQLSSKIVTEHLLSTGRIPAYLGSVHPDANLAIKKREEGYIETLRKRKLTPQIIPTTNSSETIDNQTFGYENLVAYLKDQSPPEAIFCATDRIAMGAIFALQERGFVVGQDVLVAGHDNLQFGAYMNPTLTTVAQPKQQMGTQCVKSLLNLINKKGSKQNKIHIILKPELIIRQSTMVE